MALSNGQIFKWDLEHDKKEYLIKKHYSKITSMILYDKFIITGDEMGTIQVRDITDSSYIKKENIWAGKKVFNQFSKQKHNLKIEHLLVLEIN